MTAELYAAIVDSPRQTAGVTFADPLMTLMGAGVRRVAARQLATPTPTTVGLGDAFVGGLLTALVPLPSSSQSRVPAVEGP